MGKSSKVKRSSEVEVSPKSTNFYVDEATDFFIVVKVGNKNKFPIFVDPWLSSNKKGDLHADFVIF